MPLVVVIVRLTARARVCVYVYLNSFNLIWFAVDDCVFDKHLNV